MAERLLIRPIEEVMEEEGKPSTSAAAAASAAGRLVVEEMEVDEPVVTHHRTGVNLIKLVSLTPALSRT